MNAEIDVLANPVLSIDAVHEIEAELRELGLEPQTRWAPTRRAAVEFSWLLLISIPSKVLVEVVLERAGARAHKMLRQLIERALSRPKNQTTSKSAPDTVVIESEETGARFVVHSDMPTEAYRQLVEYLADQGAAAGVWTFDPSRERWRRQASAATSARESHES